ncbi:type III-A CRISPR-associated protein Csm6 [Staphylococcus lugdunensis]|uniref:Type III-A CRISPR-associated protein Csm6 n=2 Tax=Staphylococcus TaxID=1279 RepID=A0ABX6BSL7_STALU|nr:type III-A CRISPR-associated protein Csm6 [Staphylococcus lugdunensis]QEX38008.1 type III-A CRISPR-associated protein Csm6 [Staphylococcus lugdunensis]
MIDGGKVMKVLFSPIGNTDPWSNERDGAMLHIVRHYRPEKVILFFTESIWFGNENIPGRKQFEWEKIVSKVSPQTSVEIKVENIEHEHDFDSYKDLFSYFIKGIRMSNPESEILLNVTSGTPQMESTLCLEYISNPNNAQCIQVSAPQPSNNTKRLYANPNNAFKDLEKVNQNEHLADNRCKSINILSFREVMVRSQVRGLIDNYDYEGALNLISAQKSFRNGKVLQKKLRNLTTQIKTHKIFSDLSERYSNEALKKSLFHYLLLKMRHDRLDVAETLIRVKSIAEYIIKYYIQSNWPSLILEENGKPKLNVKKMLLLYININCIYKSV